MRLSPAPLLVVAALLAGCGQPLLSAQVEVPELRIVESAKSFPGADPALIPTSLDPALLGSMDPAVLASIAAGLPTATVSVDASYDLGGDVPLLKEKTVDVDLRLTDVALHLDGGAADLRGIRTMRLELRDPDTGAFTVFASYVRPAPPPAHPMTLAASGQSSVELSRFLTSGKLDARVSLELEPVFLSTAFSASLEAGFSLVVTVDYSKFL